MFGYEVFGVNLSFNEPDLETLRDHISAHQGARRFYFTRIPTELPGLVQALAPLGFSVVDVSITFERAPEKLSETFPPDIKIAAYEQEYQEPTLQIAHDSFIYSRFHLDPHIPKNLADKVKRAWIENYILGVRGETLWIALWKGQIAAFLAIIADPHQNCKVIDLVGVGRAFQGQGIGRALVRFFIDHYQGRASLLRVGTQVANIPSVRLYESNGFRLAQSKFVLHAHHGNGT